MMLAFFVRVREDSNSDLVKRLNTSAHAEHDIQTQTGTQLGVSSPHKETCESACEQVCFLENIETH